MFDIILFYTLSFLKCLTKLYTRTYPEIVKLEGKVVTKRLK